MIPPSWCFLDFPKAGFGFWFPFFLLLWPLLLLLTLLAAPFWLLAACFLVWIPEGRVILVMPFYVYRIICTMRGLDVGIEDATTSFGIKFR